MTGEYPPYHHTLKELDHEVCLCTTEISLFLKGQCSYATLCGHVDSTISTTSSTTTLPFKRRARLAGKPPIRCARVFVKYSLFFVQTQTCFCLSEMKQKSKKSSEVYSHVVCFWKLLTMSLHTISSSCETWVGQTFPYHHNYSLDCLR